MATTANIYTLLKYYSSKQNNGAIDLAVFGDYIHRYAQHHVEENNDLVSYCSLNYMDFLQVEIRALEAQKKVVVNIIKNKEYVFVISYYIEKFSNVYKEMDNSVTKFFPTIIDLPKIIPQDVLTRQTAENFLQHGLANPETSDKYLYAIDFGKEVPYLIFPSTIRPDFLLNISLRKIQFYFSKEEVHDYFLKKLCISNPGKEMSIRTFFKQFVKNPTDAILELKNSGETFFFWSQMCFFLKQDLVKVKDLSPEDISMMHAIMIIELSTSIFKNQATLAQKKMQAFETLDNALINPPYYFSVNEIVTFKDNTGNLLLDQYSVEELREHLKIRSQETIGNQMPPLLLFKLDNGQIYYIHKEKVLPLIVRLCNDIRIQIKESIVDAWYKILYNFDIVPEMESAEAFEECLQNEVRTSNPVLSALLRASFLPVIAFEDQTPNKVILFKDNKLLSYSELLMLSRRDILQDAKARLPFIYSLPILSWILSIIKHKPKHIYKAKKAKAAEVKKQNLTREHIKQQKQYEQVKFKQQDEVAAYDPKQSRKRILRKSAATLEAIYVPEDSTLDRELKGYLKEWNDRIGKENFDNLTMDVNSLVRDYMRKTLKSLKTEPFNQERIENLSTSLVESPTFRQIKNHPALKRYIELYMIKLIKNIP